MKKIARMTGASVASARAIATRCCCPPDSFSTFRAISSCSSPSRSRIGRCTDQKGNDDQDTNLGNSVEIDDTDIEIDTEPGLDTEDNSDDAILPDGFTYSFRDPDNADGIVVTPRE
mgnify:CR=1 FL=1